MMWTEEASTKITEPAWRQAKEKGDDPRNNTKPHESARRFVSFRVASWIVPLVPPSRSPESRPVLDGIDERLDQWAIVFRVLVPDFQQRLQAFLVGVAAQVSEVEHGERGRIIFLLGKLCAPPPAPHASVALLLRQASAWG